MASMVEYLNQIKLDPVYRMAPHTDLPVKESKKNSVLKTVIDHTGDNNAV